MKKQTEYRKGTIKRYGCYFCLMLFFTEQIIKKKLSDNEVYRVYDESQKRVGINKKPMMNAVCRLDDPAGVGNIVLEEYGAKRLYQIGAMDKEGKEVYWGGMGRKYDFVAEEWETPYGVHWISADYNPDPQIDLIRLNRKIYYKVA